MNGSGGNRLLWTDLPDTVRSQAQDMLGSTVEKAVSQPGGFSPGLASRLLLANGQRVFVKAVSGAVNPQSPAMHRREAQISAVLPPEAPTPRLLWSFEDDPWVVLAYEDIDGWNPAIPWKHDELDRVLAAIDELARQLTPSPIEAPPIGELLADDLTGWRELAAKDTNGLADVDEWAHRNLARLADIESGWTDASAGTTLLHGDLRADNIVLTSDGGVYFVDWPHACTGASWVDLLCMLPSVAMQGGPTPEDVVDTHPVFAKADPAAVTAVLTALTGYFVARSLRPPPPGLPTVRAFQRSQGVVGLRWLRHRLAA